MLNKKLILCLMFFLVSCLARSVNALVVLQYHHISASAPKATSISPALFKQHLAFIEENNFRVIDIAELKKYAGKKTGAPDGTVIITFDDGYRSIYSEAYPLLKKRGWPFTVFVNSQPHDEKNPRFVSWQQLKEMSKNGATIANHTDSHPHLIRRLANESHHQWQKRIELEIDFSQKRIQKEIGKAPKFFAYPYGEYNSDLRKLLKSKGYLAFGQQSGPVGKDTDPQIIPRFPFGGEYGQMDSFATKLFSLPLPVDRVEVESSGKVRFVDPELPDGVDKPIMRLSTPLARYIKEFQCFASGQGKISTEVQSSTILVKANRSLPVGRSRYNCTANAGNGRYYWYSRLFIRRNSDGTWYNE